MRLFLAALLPLLSHATDLKPLMLIPGDKVFRDDFSQPRELKASNPKAAELGAWNPNQGTQWKVVDGVLRGEASTPAYQASHDTHKGVHPRIVLTKTPAEYLLQFSFRLVDGKPFVAGERKAVPPFIEMGHHIARLTWGANGAMLLADGDTLQVDAAPDFKLEPGKWYTVLIERRADEVVVQFQDGPTFRGKHASYVKDPHAVMLGGLEAGHMEIDNVTVWSPKEGTQQGWESFVKAHPAPTEVRLKAPKAEAETRKTKK